MTDKSAPETEDARNYRSAAVAGLIVGLATILVVSRFLLKLVGASPQSGFVAFVDRVTSPLVTPFQGAFANGGTSANVIEIASIVALLVVLIIGSALVAVISRFPVGNRQSSKGSSPVAVVDSGGSAPLPRNLRVLSVVGKSVLGAVVLLIAIRGVLLGLAASVDSGIVLWIYNVTEPLVAPFQYVFPNAGTSVNIIEFASLLAIVVYSVVGAACLQLARILTTRRDTKPAGVSQGSRSGYENGLIILFSLAWVAGTFAVIDHYTPLNSTRAATSRSQAAGASSGPTTRAPVAAPQAAAANCVPSTDGSSNGWDWHIRVDATSNSACYSHWTVAQAGGRGCQFYVSYGGPYTPPANIWNITRWGYDHSGNTGAFLRDGTFLFFNCVINLGNYPQTSLNSVDWN